MRIQLLSNSSDLNPLENLMAFNLRKIKTAALKHDHVNYKEGKYSNGERLIKQGRIARTVQKVLSSY